jgi:signal transduction histidine kinase
MPTVSSRCRLRGTFLSGRWLGCVAAWVGAALGAGSGPNQIAADGNVWTADGEQHDGGFGDVVAGVGDVNGDGFSDVLVTAPRYDDQRGRVFVFHGSKNGLASQPDWELRGLEPGDNLGFGAAAADDVNGDGFADVLVASLGHRPNRIERNVTVAIYAGSPSGLRTNALWTIRDGEDHYGCTVGSAGDVDRDGFADVFVSWLKPPPTATPHHGLFIFYGSATGPSAAPDWRLIDTSPDLKPSLGASAAAAGDVNGDGYGDLLVGARDAAGIYPHGGTVFLYAGSAAGLSNSPSWSATFDLPRRAVMDPNGVMYFGSFLAGAGDLNDDGFDDVVVAAPYADRHDPDEGMVFVYLGSKQGLPSTPNRRIEANRPYAVLGYSLAGVGDFDGDGYADVAAGAPWATFDQGSEGAVALFRGGPKGLQADPQWAWRGAESNGLLGKGVAEAGDVNGGGFGDLIASAPGHREDTGSVGRVCLWYGSRDAIPGTFTWTMTKPAGTRALEAFQEAAPLTRVVVIVTSVFVVLGSAFYAGRFLERHRQLVINRERQQARQTERERIARDLHDDMGARISELSRLMPRLDDTANLGTVNSAQLAATARELALALEQIIWSVNPEQDTLENLVVYLGQFADQFLEGFGVRCRRDVPYDLPPVKLSPEIRRDLFLATKEALNNVAKHAEASEVRLRVRWEPPRLALIIEDDGVGLSVEPRKGNGLENMRRRMAEIGSRARIERGVERGTRVTLEVELSCAESPPS